MNNDLYLKLSTTTNFISFKKDVITIQTSMEIPAEKFKKDKKGAFIGYIMQPVTYVLIENESRLFEDTGKYFALLTFELHDLQTISTIREAIMHNVDCIIKEL